LGSLGRVPSHAATATMTMRAAASPPHTGQFEPNLPPGAFACLSGELLATKIPPSNAEFGVRNAEYLRSVLNIPHSAFTIPHSSGWLAAWRKVVALSPLRL
jgi:hypothetical protein